MGKAPILVVLQGRVAWFPWQPNVVPALYVPLMLLFELCVDDILVTIRSIRQTKNTLEWSSCPGNIFIHPNLISCATGLPVFQILAGMLVLIFEKLLAPRKMWTSNSALVSSSSMNTPRR